MSFLTLKKIAIFFFIPITLYLSGLIAFIYSIPKSPAVAHIQADSGIVLTGGSGRIKAGIDLLEQGKIKTLFISGVHKSLSVSKLLRINALKSTKQNQIILGYTAQNTYGNAIESASFIKNHKTNSAYLITGAYHMPRAMQEMTYRSPNTMLISYPIHPSTIKTNKWYMFPGTLRIFFKEYTKTLAVTIRTAI